MDGQPHEHAQQDELLSDELEFAVLDLAMLGAGARQQELERLCAAHPKHARQIRALARLDALDSIEQPLPERVGPYRVVEKIGEGGMGVVYLAWQDAPVARRVAVKVIKPGMDSRRVLARFDLERQALARMEHSNIAKVFDGGLTADGRPYFVMEYVDGEPITDFAERRALGVGARLELFQEVCRGVHHAHQKGVIHRDLKPSNVLVTIEDGTPRPKIIDFGLSRAIDQRSSGQSLQTRHGQLVGTPAYMSPEQIDPDNLDIDTRTDVYSLGIVLYELLVGALPFEGTRLREAGLAGMQRVVLEDEPPRPSTRLSRSESTAAVDRTTWRRTLRGDLDRIVLKALEKLPDHRYASPAAFGDDLRRFLAHEPIEARAPSPGYRLRKFVRKHRLAVATAAIVFLASVAATITSTRALGEAEQSLADFRRLSTVVQLDEVRSLEDGLDPAWPDQLPAIEDWLRRAGLVGARLDELRATVDTLRNRATPQTAAERRSDRRSHPRYGAFTRVRDELDALRRADAVRHGRAEFQPVELDPADLPRDPAIAGRRAEFLVANDRTVFGREAEGLALIEYAQRGASGNGQHPVIISAILGWAKWANGFDDEARSCLQEGLRHHPSGPGGDFLRSQLDQIEQAIEWANGDGFEQRVAELEIELAALENVVSKRRSWRFSDPGDGFLHDALTRTVAELEAFSQEAVPRTEARRAWAERLQGELRLQHAARWRDARAAIARADGETASRAYGVRPLDLPEQVGLVPIGMNPQSKLWEFYDLRSAADPTVIPEHGADGSLQVGDGTGIVFVLIPEQELVVGEQSDHPDWPLYDPLAEKQDYMTVELLDVAPFLLSRFEMTKGQWERLSRRSDVGRFRPGSTGVGDSRPVDSSFPVEGVSWIEANRLLERFRMMLPTEAQWEAACRAGTQTVWSSGSEVASLHGHANVADAFAGRSGVTWITETAIDDGFTMLAPVGSFAPNPFGLHDVHGNVDEWCRDEYITYGGTVVMPPDSLRTVEGVEIRAQGRYRVHRGGHYRSLARGTRSAFRDHSVEERRSGETGVRPARRLRF